MNELNALLNDPRLIIDSLNDGLYVTNTDREIVFWSSSAERITGWTAEDVDGVACRDNLLCHIDKEGRSICGEDSCPLYRSIVTGERSFVPVVVYAHGKDGRKIPMQVSVSPIRSPEGEIIGAVEVFRDLTSQFHDLRRSRAIQGQALKCVVPDDFPVQIRTHYLPHDLIGGDFHAIEPVGDGELVVLQADAIGHGTAAALYTMFLRSLWDEYTGLKHSPAVFLKAVSHRLQELFNEENAFATAVCLYIDTKNREIRFSGAGHPPPMLFRKGRGPELLDASGFPLGIVENPTFEEQRLSYAAGDTLLLYTDGAVEVDDAEGHPLGTEGFLNILRDLGYPGSRVSFQAIEERLLEGCRGIHFSDDVAFIELRFIE